MIPAARPPQALPTGDLAGPPLAPQVLASGFPVLIATLAEAPVATAEGKLQIAPPCVAGEPEVPADPSPLVREGLDQLMAVVRSSIGRATGREAAAEAADGAESEAEADGEATPEAPIEAQRTAEVPSASIPPQVVMSASPPRAAVGRTGELGAIPKRATVQASPLPERPKVVAPGPGAADERTRHARMPAENGSDGEAGIRIEAASLPQARMRTEGEETPQVRRVPAAAGDQPVAAEEADLESELAEFPAPAAVVRTAQPAQPAVPPLQPNAAVPEQPQAMSAAGPVDARPAEPAVDRQLDLALDGEWLDQLARDIARSSYEGRTPLRFRLHPEHLGHLKVEIVQDAGGAAVRLTADNEAARSIIADAQPRLIAEARAQGVRISEAYVDLGGQQTLGDPRREQAQQEPALRTARLLHDGPQDRERDDGKPTPARAERYA